MGDLGDYWREARESRWRHRMFNMVECGGCGLYANGNAVKVDYGGRCHRCGWEAPPKPPRERYTKADFAFDDPKNEPCPVCGKKMRDKQAVHDHVRGKTCSGDKEHQSYWRKNKKALKADAKAEAERAADLDVLI